MSTVQFKIVQAELLDSADLPLSFLEQAAATLAAGPIDFGDLYFERAEAESFYLEEGIIKAGSFDIDKGVGIRAVAGEKTGFAYSDVLDRPSILAACRAAGSIAAGHSCPRVRIGAPRELKPLYTMENPLNSWERERKAAFLQELDAAARSASPYVTQVTAHLACVHKMFLVLTTDGQISCDIKPVIHASVTAVLEKDGRRESGFAARGGAVLLDALSDPKLPAELAGEAVRIAQVNLAACQGPVGTMPVVLGAGWPGVLIHEAVGHGLEGDFNRTGSSAFSGKVGQQVASSCCTVIDDGSMPNRRGSVTCDDEGTPGQRNVLIENGILKGYMQDRQNASLMGVKPTGNGRRQDYSCLPLPRMTNTYLQPGDYAPEEIITSVDSGIYAVNFSGGQVDITSGRFVFCTSEAFLIEHGRVTAPIKGVTLIGNGPEVMQQIAMVGNDLAFDQGIGVCGKAGQSVPVGIGQPTVKVSALTVGGTQG